MSEGPDALKAHLLSDTVFLCIKPGYIETADLFFSLWLEPANRLTVTGTSTSFLAEDRGTEDIIGCLAQAGD